MGKRVYAGASTRSRREPVVYACPCGERFAAEAYRAVDSANAEATARLLEGRLNQLRCPSCEAIADVQVPVVYHDLEAQRLVLILPDGLRHRELAERARFFEALDADHEPPTSYVLDAQVVFGVAGLRAALAPEKTDEMWKAPAATEPSAVVPPGVLTAAPAPTSAARPSAERETPAARPIDPKLARKVARPELRIQPKLPDPRPELRRTEPRAEARPDPRTDPRTDQRSEPRELRVEPRAEPREKNVEVTASSLSQLTTPQHTDFEDEGHTRVRVTVPDPRSAMTERWIAGREGPAAFLVDDSVMVCAALPPPALECFVPATLEVRVQLHRLPSYPILAITLVAQAAPPGKEGKPRTDDARVLTVPLDVARAAHRVVLDALGRKCSIAVELYDSQYLPVISHAVAAPLEENVRRLVAEAKDALDRLAPQSRNFERARGLMFQATYDRLGRTQVDLPDDAVETLDKPAAVLAALSQVARWSEPSAEAYLVEIRSLPLVRWRALRARIIHRALDIGIAVSRPLVERTAKEYTSPLPSWQELLAIQVRRFAEISARVKPNDLSAAEEAENWDLLLRECALAGVVVDDQVRQLAEAAVRRVRASSGGGVDLRTLETTELVALLERKELRREAAIILCERRETPTLPALFSVIRRMPRGEANLVLPAVTGFGAPAERWLIEGLKSKKSFMRQGCALALGTLRTPLGVDALVRILLFEPTEIWTEVARALGDAGNQAVMPLAARLREVDAERKDRVVLALAHIAARPPGSGRAPIDMLASGRDTMVAQAAGRALAMLEDVRAADEQVRHGTQAEQTVVRGFSRRFYETLEGGTSARGSSSGAIELSGEELEEVDEEEAELDDHDLLTATDIPILRPRSADENTSPVPKASLPREQG